MNTSDWTYFWEYHGWLCLVPRRVSAPVTSGVAIRSWIWLCWNFGRVDLGALMRVVAETQFNSGQYAMYQTLKAESNNEADIIANLGSIGSKAGPTYH